MVKSFPPAHRWLAMLIGSRSDGHVWSAPGFEGEKKLKIARILVGRGHLWSDLDTSGPEEDFNVLPGLCLKNKTG